MSCVTHHQCDCNEERMLKLEIALKRLSLRIARQRPKVELVGHLAEWQKIADNALNGRR